MATYERVKGSSRRYRDTETGETISRRQYDQKHGRLAGTGLTLEGQAKARKTVRVQKQKRSHGWTITTVSSPREVFAFLSTQGLSKSTFIVTHGLATGGTDGDTYGEVYRTTLKKTRVRTAVDLLVDDPFMLYGDFDTVYDYAVHVK